MLLALAALGIGGAVDPWYGIRASADLGGTDPARIREALESDPEFEIVRTFHAEDGVDFWCGRGPTVAHVSAHRSNSVVVSIGRLNYPSADELTDWNRLADDICARIDAACPEVGEWERTREPQMGGGWSLLIFVVVGLACLVGATVGVVLLVLKLDRWMSAALK